jgi:glycine betaine catabolism A
MLNLPKIRSLLETRRPKHTLPQDFYLDPGVFAFDLAVIYQQNWILVGFEVEVPEPGSYLAFPIGQSPVLVVRGQDGALRGFYNSCRHRGAQICETGRGAQSWLICPYHQWTYGLDGKLANAPRMGSELDHAELGLRPIHVETVAGSIYVCLAEQPPAFGGFRDQVAPLLAPHKLANAKLAFESTLTIRANWKLVMENARECYHCAARHPELAVTYPVQGSRAVQFGDVQRFKRFCTRMADAGLQVGPVDGPWWHAMRFPLNDGAVTLSMDGQLSCTRLMCDAANGDIGTVGWTLEPHCFAHVTSDSAFMFSAMPTAPQETVVTSKWLVHKDAVEGVDYRVDTLTELWTKTNEQDRDLCEANQRGVNSLGYLPGPYSEDVEVSVMRFVDWYCGEANDYLDRHTLSGQCAYAGPRLAAVAGGS